MMILITVFLSLLLMQSTASTSSSTGPSFTDYFLAGLLTGSTVMISNGIMESFFGFGLGVSNPLIRLIINLTTSAVSGFLAIWLVALTGLMNP